MAKILSISSTVTTGHVGNAAAMFALQRLGHQVWPLTTIALPHHPGHGAIAPDARLVTPPGALDANLRALEAQGWLTGIDAVLVGYMATAGQSRIVAGWLGRLRQITPSLLIMVDPILGDGDVLYVQTDVAEAARDRLLPLADIVKPNRFELGWLSGKPVVTETATLAAAQTLGVNEVVVTSAPSPSGNAANLTLTGSGAWTTQTPRIDPAPKGTGDLFGALYLSSRLKGEPPARALERATAGVFAILTVTKDRGCRELALVTGQERLTEPGRPFAARPIDDMAVPEGSLKP